MRAGKVILYFILALSLAGSVNAGVDANAIELLSKDSTDVYNEFMRSSIEGRSEYDIFGFMAEWKTREEFAAIAMESLNRLSGIGERQGKNLQVIEDYDGDDWEELYGESGLWRKLAGDIDRNDYYSLEIKYFANVYGDGDKDELKVLLEKVTKRQGQSNNAYWMFLEARILGRLGAEENTYMEQAREGFDELRLISSVSRSVAFRFDIERIRAIGEEDSCNIKGLAEDLAEAGGIDEAGVLIEFACLAHRLNEWDMFAEIISSNAAVEGFFAKLFISAFEAASKNAEKGEEIISRVSIYDAELGAQYAKQRDGDKYTEALLFACSVEKYQRPLVLMIAAEKVCEQRPGDAIALFVKACQVQAVDADNSLKMDAAGIGEYCLRLAFEKFAAQKIELKTVTFAFKNFKAITGEGGDINLDLRYASVLKAGERFGEYVDVLDDIIKSGDKYYSRKAEYELIKYRLGDKATEDAAIASFCELVKKCPYDDERIKEFKRKIAEHCSGILLGKGEYNKVIDLLGYLRLVELANDDMCLCYNKSLAYYNVGEVNGAAKYLAMAISKGDGDYFSFSFRLISGVVEAIDALSEQEKFDELIKDCVVIAAFVGKRASDEYRFYADVYEAEVLVFAAGIDKGFAAKAKECVQALRSEYDGSNVDVLRCAGRFFLMDGQYFQASQSWGQVAGIYKAMSKDGAKSAKWWGAKYFELFSVSVVSGEKAGDVLHTIEVFENSGEEIPAFWRSKMLKLKKNLNKDASNK